LSTWLLFSTASPPFAMPPAAIGGPSPGAAVAVLPLTWLLLSTRWLVPGGMPPLPLPLAMPPPFSEVLPLTWLLLRVTVPSRFWMPPPLPSAVFPVPWVLLMGRALPVSEERKSSPLADPPPTNPCAVLLLTWLLLRVTVPRTLTTPPPPRLPSSSEPSVWLLRVTELLFRVSLATLEGSEVALAMPPAAWVAVL